ncbi:FecR domain-containing protein [Anseongella ginsenosidimutans]|nr:FecR domain-containing protein [Anseongella ginsenosidimutans]
MELHKKEYWDLVSAYLAGTISDEERSRLLQWLEEDPARTLQLKELEKIWDRSKNNPLPAFDVEQAWKKLQPQIRERKKPVLRKVSGWSFRAAASVALLILAGTLVYFLLKPGYSDVFIATLPGETKNIVLPDGSRVVLNENSSISYDAGLDRNRERRVKLKGEAFFEVSKDPQKKFIVGAGETETRVLGTSFNVLFDDAAQQVKVSLLSGIVRFVPGRNEKAVGLAPGEEVIYNSRDRSLSKKAFENENFLFWKNRKLEFADQQLEDVLALVGESYGVSFRIKDPQLGGLRVTSAFDQSSLAEVINVLENLLDIRIEGTGNVYTVWAE